MVGHCKDQQAGPQIGTSTLNLYKRLSWANARLLRVSAIALTKGQGNRSAGLSRDSRMSSVHGRG